MVPFLRGNDNLIRGPFDNEKGALPKIWGIVCACCFDRCSVIYSWKRGKEGVLSFQEDDGDGKVPVSALTRWDGPWPGGDKRSSAHGGSDLHTALRTLPWVWESLRRCPLSVSANSSRRAVRRPERGPPTLCTQVFLPGAHLSPESVCREAIKFVKSSFSLSQGFSKVECNCLGPLGTCQRS